MPGCPDYAEYWGRVTEPGRVELYYSSIHIGTIAFEEGTGTRILFWRADRHPVPDPETVLWFVVRTPGRLDLGPVRKRRTHRRYRHGT